MLPKLFIHASNVHQGGGRSLLTAIMRALPVGVEPILSLDNRMPLPDCISSEIQVKRVKPSLIERFSIERWLVNTAEEGDTILCFGNLPPLFKSRAYVIVFLQNRYLVDNVKLSDASFRIRLKFWLERLWMLGKVSNADELIVQTPSMKALLEKRIKGKVPIRILPFVDENANHTRKVRPMERERNERFEFLYVASGETHKNHRKLVKAWCILAKEGIFPSLKLTLDAVQFQNLCGWIERTSEQYQLNIDNVGSIPHEQVKQLYGQMSALIYPSTMESFGLPLIEAVRANIPVLASELDYVRDVLDPEQTFDPESSRSIARAVKRFLKIDEQELPLSNARDFMRIILDKGNDDRWNYS